MIKNSHRYLILLLWVGIFGCAKPNALFQTPMVGIMQNNQVPILVKGISQGKVRI